MQTQLVPTLKRQTNPFFKEKRLSSLPMSTRLGKKHFDEMGKKELLLGKTFPFSKGTLFFLKLYFPNKALKKGTFFLDKVGRPQGKRQYEEQKTLRSLMSEGQKFLRKG